MGAPLEITVSGEKLSASRAIEAAFLEVARIEGLFSIYQQKSPLALLNLSKTKGFFQLEREIIEVVSQAIQYAQLSGGAFDPTASPLVDLWGFGTSGEKKDPPSKREITAALKWVGFQNLKIYPDKNQLERLKESMTLNLGGIVKGYAIDRATARLKASGITHGLVSFGSTLYGFGRPEWRVAIRHPRNLEETIATVALSDRALATSGDYERCFFYQGKRYSHIIDPQTGYPTRGIASASVIAPTAMAADALSTAAFVLGKEKGNALLESLPGIEGFLIPENQTGALSRRETAGWRACSVLESVERRHFLAMACAAVIGLMLPVRAEGAKIQFATEEEAFKRLIPTADRYEVDQIVLSKDQLSQAQQLAGKEFRKKEYRFRVGQRGTEAVGYALKLNVIGKKRPITFLVGIDPQGEVLGIEVLIYRESRGSQVRFPRFMKQFLKKTTEDPLRLGRDIRPISGATLSSRSTAYAARKALAIFEVVYKSGAAH